MESAPVKAFFDRNKDLEKLSKATKILITLIQNAITTKKQGDDDGKFQRIRLGNPKIQRTVLSQIGALQLLMHCGFEKQTDSETGEKILLYNNASISSEKVALDTVRQLQVRLKRFQDAPSVALQGNNNTNTNATAFLSDKERQKRQEMAREKRKAEKAAKEAALKRWQEDKEARDERAARHTAAKEAALKTGKGGFDASRSDIHIERIVPPSKLLASGAASSHAAPNAPPSAVPSLPRATIVPDPPLEPSNQLKQPPPSQPSLEKSEEESDQPLHIDGLKPKSTNNSMDITTSHDSSDDERAKVWAQYLQHIPLCAAAEGIKESSVYWRHTEAVMSSSSPACLKPLLRELDGISELVPNDPRCSIFVRFDEETPQYIRALVAAALPGPTPYSGGLFCFDIYIPDEYPNTNPKVQLVTTGGGTVRFGPNLYKDGKVCLSLLGTWNGPKWNPRVSNLSQVLLSIQGLVLGAEHPYFLEPGHGGWEGTVKTGDFLSTGQTLSGKVIQEDFKLPPAAAEYEDQIRIATIRFAMLEMLRAASSSSMSQRSLQHLQSFQFPIQAHFYHNKEAIMREVNTWESQNRSFAGGRTQNIPGEVNQQLVATITARLKNLVPVLERELRSVAPPDFASTTLPAMDTGKTASSMRELDLVDTEKAERSPAAAVATTPVQPVEPAQQQTEEMDVVSGDTEMVEPAESHSTPSAKSSDNPLEDLKAFMQKAASSGDYITAGKLQQSITVLEDLNQQMTDAASKGNFIRAGKLQEQFQARLSAVQDMPREEEGKKQSQTMMDVMNGNGEDDMEESDNGEDMSDFEEEQDVSPMTAQWGKPARWGKGRTLRDSVEESSEVTSGVASMPGAQNMVACGTASVMTTTECGTRPASGVTCRLRIRLPDSQTLDEKFDANDTIGDVYRRISPHVQPPAQEASKSTNVASMATRRPVATPYGMHMAEAPVFARPLSLNGFTLLMTRPKREFSLEMDGTKTLQEMDLVPSATVAVMMCKERGMVRRGDLESRLNQAQGDAMDVEGLPYESLLELTERVGASDVDWTQDDEAALESKSSLISPALYVTGQKEGGTSDEELKCPICLGEFDVTDTQASLRQLNTCRHSGNTFHEACLRTWMQKRKSCPICKDALAAS